MPKFHVQRSIEIDASPEEVFDFVSDFSKWSIWSPWLCAEPEAEVTVSEDPKSVGSLYEWKGEVTGQGEIEHRVLERGQLIDMEIRFLKPWKSRSDVSFDLEPAGSGTKITWHMHGSLPWFMFWMVSQMDVFIGMDYERGLKMMKEQIETGTILSKTIVHGVKPVGPMKMAGVKRTCHISEIAAVAAKAFPDVREKLGQNGLPCDTEAISVYHDCDLKKGIFNFTAGFFIPESESAPDGLSSWSIPEMKALSVEHIGSYQNLGNPWAAAHQVARYRKLKQAKVGTFEIYRNDPNLVTPAELQTEIFLPLR